MLHLGEGRTEEAWQDILACYRLSRLTGQGWCMVQQLIAIAIDSLSCNQTVVLLHHGKMTSQKARQILRQLQTLPKRPAMSDSIDQGERLAYLDAVISVATGRGDAMTIQGGNITMLADWDNVLKDGNDFFDRLVAAGDRPRREQRNKNLAEVEKELSQRAKESSQPMAKVAVFFSRQSRSELMSNIMLSLMTPATSAVFGAEDRSLANREMVITAAALTVFRAEHGTYPQQLPELVPDILPRLPLDLYSGKSFIYARKSDGGYLLYSLFENGVDDGGTGYSGAIVAGEWVDARDDTVNYDQTDLVIRVPVPTFKLPKTPTDEEN